MVKEYFGPCQVEGCGRWAKFNLYRTLKDGTKEWINVCREHEGWIGMENLSRLGGYIDGSRMKLNCNQCQFTNEDDLCDKKHPERQSGYAYFARVCPDYKPMEGIKQHS